MKKIGIFLYSVFVCFGLFACNKKTENSNQGTKTPVENQDNYEEMFQDYGKFSISSVPAEAAYSVKNNVYTLNENNAEYTIEGYLAGRVEVTGTKVTVIFKDAVIYSENGAAISYTPNSKSLTIKSQKDTTNYLVTSALANASSTVESNNNIKFTGSGQMNIIASVGNAIDGSDVSVKNTQMKITAKDGDAFNAKQVAILYDRVLTIDTATNVATESDIQNSTLVEILEANKAFDCNKNTKGSKGNLYLFGGTIKVLKATTIFDLEGDLMISTKAVWDEEEYSAQKVSVFYPKEATLYNVLGAKTIDEGLATISRNA